MQEPGLLGLLGCGAQIAHWLGARHAAESGLLGLGCKLGPQKQEELNLCDDEEVQDENEKCFLAACHWWCRRHGKGVHTVQFVVRGLLGRPGAETARFCTLCCAVMGV